MNQMEVNSLKLDHANNLKEALRQQKINIIKQFLPLVDACSKYKPLYTLANNTLQQLDVKTVQSEYFDPYYHEVIKTKRISKFDDGKILQTTRTGYFIDSDIIRYAQVIANQNE